MEKLPAVFTITSHEPYVIPKKYDKKFNHGKTQSTTVSEAFCSII